jgi:hypothetical protein
LVKKYDYAIEYSGAYTADISNLNNFNLYTDAEEKSFRKFIDQVEITDVTRRRSFKIGVRGVSPGMPDTIEHKFVQISDQHDSINHYRDANIIYDQGGWSIGEYLFSA